MDARAAAISETLRAKSGAVWNIDGTCSVVECEAGAEHLGFCDRHYRRFRRYGDPLAGQAPKGLKLTCMVDGCAEQVRAQFRCRVHYQEWWKEQRSACSVADCATPANSRGLCPRHYQRLRKYGDPLAGPAFRRVRGTGRPEYLNKVRKAERRALTDEMLSYIEVLQGDPCAYCGKVAGTIDHIVPFSGGGRLTLDNATAACQSCNSRKSNTPLLRFLLLREVA